MIRNLARRLEQMALGVPASILEGIDELLTVIRLGLPIELRRSLARTNIIENMMGSIRRVCRNVKRWRDASMALRWTGAAMLEAAERFRRLKAHRQLPVLRSALASCRQSIRASLFLSRMRWLRRMLSGQRLAANFNIWRDISRYRPGAADDRPIQVRLLFFWAPKIHSAVLRPGFAVARQTV